MVNEMTPLEWKRKQLYDAHMQLATINAMADSVSAWQDNAKSRIKGLEMELEAMESPLKTVQ